MRRATRDHRATYLLAARTTKSTWVLVALAPISVAAMVLLHVLVGTEGDWLSTTGLIAATALLVAAVGSWSSRRMLILDGRGLYCASRAGGRQYAEWVPLELLDGFEVRQWTMPDVVPWWLEGPASSDARLSARLVDGRRLLTSWGRQQEPGGRWRPLVLKRRAGQMWASAATTRAGHPLRWDVGTDAELVALLECELAVIRAAIVDAGVRRNPIEPEDWKPTFLVSDVQWRTPTSTDAEREWRSRRVDGDDTPIPAPAPPPIPARPVAPRAPHAKPRATKAEASGPLPGVFWSLASERSGSLLGRRSSMTIASGGVTFDRRWRRDLHVDLHGVERFDVIFDALVPGAAPAKGEVLPGNWRLVLVLTDGSTVPLSGLDHGYFKGNRLLWSPAQPERRRKPTPTGSMPWPNDQPLEVATLLNATLDTAKGQVASPAQENG